MAFTFTPNDATTVAVQIGIDNLLANYILQNEDIEEKADMLKIPDQKGRTAQVIAYQKSYSLSLTAVGPGTTAPTTAGATLEYYDGVGTSINYIIDSCRKTSTYNDTSKWQITGTAYLSAVYADKTDSSI